MPPIAKPQFLAQLLRHMSDLSGKSPRKVIEMINPEVWQGTRDIVGAMSPEKLQIMSERFMPKDIYDARMRANRYKDIQGFVSSNPPVPSNTPGMVAMPPEALNWYGPSIVPHEGRHVQQHNSIYDQIVPNSGEFHFKDSASNRLIPIAKFDELRDMHNNLTGREVDAALSETATMEAAGFNINKVMPGNTYLPHKERFISSYIKTWDKLPDWIKDHYRKTIGVAAPAIGAFQPETQE